MENFECAHARQYIIGKYCICHSQKRNKFIPNILSLYNSGVDCQKAHFKTHKMYCSAFLAKKESKKKVENAKQMSNQSERNEGDVLSISQAVLEVVRNASASDNIDEDSPLVKGKVDAREVLICLSSHKDIDHEFRRRVLWAPTKDNGILAVKTLGGAVSVLAYQCTSL